MRCTCLMSLLLCLAIAAVPGLGQDGSAEQRLLEWVESRGGQVCQVMAVGWSSMPISRTRL